MQGGKIKYTLEEYVGLDKKQISYMKKQHSRACTIFKNYPQCYTLEHEIGLNLRDDDNSSSDDERLAKAKRNKQASQEMEENPSLIL